MNKYALSFKSPTEILKYIEEQDIQFIDFNFTDLRGKWLHMTQHASSFTKEKITHGITFDGSSVPGWSDIHRSDMILTPDISRVTYDPFAAQKTVKIFCDIHKTSAASGPYTRDPRSVARAAENYLKKSGVADTANFGPKPEFFVFDDVQVFTEDHHVSYMLDSDELPSNKGRNYPTGNMGHRPTTKGGYGSEAPIDSLSDIRAEMLTVIETMGITVEKHHHEIAPSQCEVGMQYASLLEAADNVQLYKHAVHNVAHSYGKSATFMPKPINCDNGSGMHVHQSLWKNGKPIFAGSGYADLSETALYYIGGILKHGRALNAFTNSTTNSYKRLTPGYQAPIFLTYSALNRSAACRIPHSATPKERRVEMRFPDPLSNPYLALAAMLMAGLDGVENKIHPGDAVDKNLYTISGNEHARTPKLCASLNEALEALEKDHDFLLKDNVFTMDLLESFIQLKREEIERYEKMTHPVEVDMYYSG